MHQIGIRSRLGNLILAVTGAAYVLAALSVLVYYWATSGAAGSLALQVLLLACIAGSLWLVLIASANLRGRRLQ
jgi:hypothetical protein